MMHRRHALSPAATLPLRSPGIGMTATPVTSLDQGRDAELEEESGLGNGSIFIGTSSP